MTLEETEISLAIKSLSGPDADLISPNDFVIIQMPSSNSKLVQMIPNTLIQLGKFGKFKSDLLIGKHYQCMYEILNDDIVPMPFFDLMVELGSFLRGLTE